MLVWVGLDGLVLVRIRHGLTWIDLDSLGLACASLDWLAFACSGLHWLGLTWIDFS